MKQKKLWIVLRIAIEYAIVSTLWIIFSDRLAAIIAVDREMLTMISIYKGFFFVIGTSVALGIAIYIELKRIERLEYKSSAAEESYRRFYLNAPVSLQTLDGNGKIIRVNQTWQDTLGYAEAEAVNHLFDDFLIADDITRFRHWLKRINPAVQSDTIVFSLRCKDDEVIPSLFFSRVFFTTNDQLDHIEFAFQDLRKQQELEALTQQITEEYYTIVNAVPAIIIFVDHENRIQRVNEAAVRLAGKFIADMLGKPITSCYPDIDQEDLDEIKQIFSTAQPVMGKLKQMTHSNAFEWGQVDFIPYFDRNGVVAGVVLFINDVTARINRERELNLLLQFSQDLRSSSTLEDTLRYGVENGRRSLGASSSAWFPAQSEISPILDGEWRSLSPGQIQDLKPLIISILTANRSMNLLCIEQVWEYPEETRQFMKSLHQPYILVVPVHLTNQNEGIICLGFHHQVNANSMKFFETLIETFSNSIQRKLLADRTIQRLNRLGALHFIDLAVASSFDWRVTLNVLVNQAVNLLMVDAVLILIYDPQMQLLTYGAGIGFKNTEYKNVRLRIGESLAGRVALNRQIMIVPDIQKSDDLGIIQFASTLDQFVSYGAAPLISKGKIKGVIELFNRTVLKPDDEWTEFLEMLAAQAAIAIDNADLFENLQRSNSELVQAYDALITGWSHALELRDSETQGHTSRLVDLTIQLAQKVGIPESEFSHIRRGILLHDIGKMGIPDAILLKPGPLTDEEWEVMKRHPEYAYNLLIDVPHLRSATEIPLYHHERWNGSGYPHGLKGEEIPLAARVFSVVDIWDALTNDRPYRKAWPAEKAKAYLSEQSNILLDAQVVQAFLELLDDADNPFGFTD
jgi:PAS domain S-box-containing protein